MAFLIAFVLLLVQNRRFLIRTGRREMGHVHSDSIASVCHLQDGAMIPCPCFVKGWIQLSVKEGLGKMVLCPWETLLYFIFEACRGCFEHLVQPFPSRVVFQLQIVGGQPIFS